MCDKRRLAFFAHAVMSRHAEEIRSSGCRKAQNCNFWTSIIRPVLSVAHTMTGLLSVGREREAWNHLPINDVPWCFSCGYIRSAVYRSTDQVNAGWTRTADHCSWALLLEMLSCMWLTLSANFPTYVATRNKRKWILSGKHSLQLTLHFWRMSFSVTLNRWDNVR
jgi:hypothetical protein